ncbi:MAG: RNA polymerase sigma factor [Phycisphaerales bacterium]
MTRQEEQAIIERAAAGDQAAAGDLIRAHQRSLFAYMLRMSGKPEIAEDIVQDAFVRVLTNLDRFDPRFRFSTWLFTIAKRLYVNAMQKHKPVYDTGVVDSAGGGWAEPEGLVSERETATNARTAIDRALAMLSPEQREIIILFHQQDWPISQIADYMDMPEGTIKSHLHRGRRKMKTYFERCEQEGTLSPAVLDALR